MGNEFEDVLLEKVRAAIKRAGGMRVTSEKTGISPKTLEKYMAGTSMPSFDKAAKIAAAAGISVAEMAGEPPSQSLSQSMTARPVLPAAVLRIVDEAIRRLHHEAKVRLAADVIMPETLRHAQAMIDRMDDPNDDAEAMTLAPWIEGRIRKELQAAAAAPGTGKREAS